VTDRASEAVTDRAGEAVHGNRVIVEADGGSRGNPGPAGYGAVVLDADTGELLAERSGFLGVATNNVAEYRGLIAGLTAAAELGARGVTVRMDSKLVVEQMSGRWQVKHPAMRPLAARAAELARGFDTISFGWIPRLQNSAADRLANQAMDAGAEQPEPSPSRDSSAPDSPSSRQAEPQLLFQPEPAAVAEPTPMRAARPANNNAGWATEPATRFILLRHGVTEYSLSGRFAGRSDLDLTADGIEQAQRAAERIAELGEVAAIYSSPLLRTRHTAELVAQRLGTPVTVEDGLIETDFGNWDGYTLEEVRQKWPAELDRWLADPAVSPPAGESLEVTTRRVQQARNRILRRQAGRTVLLVSHVWPIKALVRLALGAPPAALHRMYLGPAAISVIGYSEDSVSLRSFNETGHLTQA
jgi:ribonuclease H / adenosylcobalamin/alpha-ribazole phosphatase